ncbi:zinc-ribbon domain-containing protein [Haloprofundus salinisoli]|uniref:zinc-ribbon domain-containing protein n=1 Tax=Haloprofundus salinisoli TaxID=2876193 RepID=UPI001CCBF18C|nr:zinc ribbon domain-containing protein [Haloprofundus salinisoli]
MLLFIIFGWPRRSKEYGETYPGHCSHCDNDQYYELRKSRRWLTLYFLPLLPLERATRGLFCSICGTGFELDRTQFKAAKSLSKSTTAFAEGDLSEREYGRELETFEATLDISGTTNTERSDDV